MENKKQAFHVSAFPCFFPSGSKAGKGFSLGSFLGKETAYFYRGAYAIWQGIKSLGLGPQDEILAPAYHCGIEIEAIANAGPKVEFYAIKENMRVDLGDIQSKISPNTKALFIIHYFGFPQPLDELKALCHNHGLALIEDCAHAFLSRDGQRPLGTVGDLSIFSFRKSLPVPDGGALVYANGKRENEKRMLYKPGFMNTQRGLMLLRLEALRLKRSLLSKMMDNVFLPAVKNVFKMVKKAGAVKVSVPDSMEFCSDEVDLGMSEQSLQILKRLNPVEIVNRRRENFIFFLERLSGLKQVWPVFQDLPVGVCPLFFPILVEDRDKARELLAKRGVQTFVFGKELNAMFRRGGFPIAEKFSAQNLCLPVHQDLEERHLVFIAEALREAVVA